MKSFRVYIKPQAVSLTFLHNAKDMIESSYSSKEVGRWEGSGKNSYSQNCTIFSPILNHHHRWTPPTGFVLTRTSVVAAYLRWNGKHTEASRSDPSLIGGLALTDRPADMETPQSKTRWQRGRGGGSLYCAELRIPGDIQLHVVLVW